MTIETIVPEAQGKFGPKVNGVFYSFSKFYKGSKDLAVGVPVDVDVFTSDTGKKYINAVVPIQPRSSQTGSIITPVLPIKQAEAKTEVKTDWVAKDRSQLVGGRSHDAVELVNTSLVTGTPLDDVMKMYKEALERVLDIAQEVK